MDPADLAALVALSRLAGVGGTTVRRLVIRFGGAEAVLAAAEDDLLAVPRVTAATVAAVRQAADGIESLREEMMGLEERGVTVLPFTDFPRNLAAISDPPAVLYLCGELTAADDLAVAVIGSRSASEGGRAAAARIATGLAAAGVTVVSGLAAGIDTAAHRAALESGGRSLGVLGAGIANPPASMDREVAGLMKESGGILSECDPRARVNPPALMMRDRIVTGLSLAVVVIEAGPLGGTMDTAERARRQGRPLFVLNWPDEDDGTAGNRRLLGAGAEALDAASDAGLERILKACEDVAQQLDHEDPPPPQPTLF